MPEDVVPMSQFDGTVYPVPMIASGVCGIHETRSRCSNARRRKLT